MNTPIPCRNCGTLHVMTEGSVISRCLACPVKDIFPPLIVKHSESLADTVFEPREFVTLETKDQLKELEEWTNTAIGHLKESIHDKEVRWNGNGTTHLRSLVEAYTNVLAKIAEMRRG